MEDWQHLTHAIDDQDDIKKWKAMIVQEQDHEAVLGSFADHVFQHKKLSKSEVDAILRSLQGLRRTAAYRNLNSGLLCLAKKSHILGNLDSELAIATALLDAGANIKYFRDVAESYSGSLTEGVAPLGYKTKYSKESTFLLATGDLRDLFDQHEAKSAQ